MQIKSALRLLTMSTKPLILYTLILTLLLSAATITNSSVLRRRKPCNEMVFYYHDILYLGYNRENATSVIVGAPDWGSKTKLTAPYSYGALVVFDDPITLDNNLHSTPVGRAQGMYFYVQQHTYGAWFTFSFVFNSTEHKGSIEFVGSDPMMNKNREVSVVGGTGDFFMARGIAILSTDYAEGDVYFRLRVDVKLYECY